MIDFATDKLLYLKAPAEFIFAGALSAKRIELMIVAFS